MPDHELLARFILRKDYVRFDKTVKPNAFIPPKNLQLSVTRHLSLTVELIWRAGEEVAAIQNLPLHGRADIECSHVTKLGLIARASPLPTNSNHADIIAWPDDKPAQKLLAQELAANSTYVSKS